MPCRRCSECRNSDHHWLDNMDWETESDPNYRCKHCPAVGVDCSQCDEGLSNGKRCGVCQGAGVLQCGTDETEAELMRDCQEQRIEDAQKAGDPWC